MALVHRIPYSVSVRQNQIYQNLGQEDHPAILLWAGYLNVSNVEVIANTVSETASWAVVRVYGSAGWVQNSQVQNNTVYDSGGIVDCIALNGQFSGITVTGNTLNGGVCN